MRSSDKPLLDAIVNKDHVAFNELYGRYWHLFYRWTFSRVKDREMTQDIMQKFWMSVWDHAEGIKTDRQGVARSFLIHALSYHILDYLKSAESRLFGAEDEELEKASGSLVYTHILEELEVKDLHKAIDRVLDTLPEVTRNVYILRERKNFSIKETAGYLSVSEKTVRNSLSQAFIAIRRQLANSAMLLFFSLYLYQFLPCSFSC